MHYFRLICCIDFRNLTNYNLFIKADLPILLFLQETLLIVNNIMIPRLKDGKKFCIQRVPIEESVKLHTKPLSLENADNSPEEWCYLARQ